MATATPVQRSHEGKGNVSHGMEGGNMKKIANARTQSEESTVLSTTLNLPSYWIDSAHLMLLETFWGGG